MQHYIYIYIYIIDWLKILFVPDEASTYWNKWKKVFPEGKEVRFSYVFFFWFFFY